MEAGHEVDSFFHCTDMGGRVPSVEEDQYFEITEAVFRKIAYREGSDGMIAVFKTPAHELSRIKLSANPLILILESVEKPGNLGAVLRVADACNADAVIICDPRTDLYNPNVIRSSVGCIFTRQLGVCGTADCQNWLTKNKISTFAASPDATLIHTTAELSGAIALVFGTEATGLSEKWLRFGKMVRIPMLGKNDSLNVATSVAILSYEALRQRNFSCE